MRRMSDSITRWAAAIAKNIPVSTDRSSMLTALGDFGSNPGALKAYVHEPADLRPGAPLVVVLHGCTQTAGGYDKASGWSQLADEQGFVLLYPEQQRSNNANGCFNWFEPHDTRRGAGEALSIRQMIAEVQNRLAIDPQRIFITGLSAGGAMAATMLATYPEIFAGGAIIAGLPHGSAANMGQAFERMRGARRPSAAELQASLRKASDHPGPWPRISIWHGDADATVRVSNAEAILNQWRGVHGLPDHPTVVDRIDHVVHRAWHGPDGRILVEDYIIPGMAHGTPLKTTGAGAYGSSAPFMLDVDISSTFRIAQFWGIAGAVARRASKPRQEPVPPTTLPVPAEPRRLHGRRIEPEAIRMPSGVGKVIEDALRAAGLMK
jgi:poly(hydroxyalkanoate) depolymerase family esterase